MYRFRALETSAKTNSDQRRTVYWMSEKCLHHNMLTVFNFFMFTFSLDSHYGLFKSLLPCHLSSTRWLMDHSSAFTQADHQKMSFDLDQTAQCECVLKASDPASCCFRPLLLSSPSLFISYESMCNKCFKSINSKKGHYCFSKNILY